MTTTTTTTTTTGSTRARRGAVLALSTLTLLGTLAAPALAGLDITGGCSSSDAGWSGSTDEREVLTTSGGGGSMTIDPFDERMSGSLSVSQDECGSAGDLSDSIVVGAGTSGKAAGEEVWLSARMRFDGTVQAAGGGATYSAVASATASFFLTSAEQGDQRAASSAQLLVESSAFEGSEPYTRVTESWGHRGEDTALGDYQRGEGPALAGLDTDWQPVGVRAVVGERLHVSMALDLYAGGSSADALVAVDRFEVDLEALDAGVVLHRGDDQPEPDPAPRTPDQVLAEARALLAASDVHHGVARALDGKLAKAADDAALGLDACDDLADTAAHVRAQTGKKVSADLAADLQALVQETQDLLGC